jgi:hypothetical protein
LIVEDWNLFVIWVFGFVIFFLSEMEEWLFNHQWEESMEILVCVKRVPDSAENEIEVNRDGSDIERDDLVYSVNEWDNYAVEEAILIRDAGGRQRHGDYGGRRRIRRGAAPGDGHGRRQRVIALRRCLRRVGRQRGRQPAQGGRGERATTT